MAAAAAEPHARAKAVAANTQCMLGQQFSSAWSMQQLQHQLWLQNRARSRRSRTKELVPQQWQSTKWPCQPSCPPAIDCHVHGGFLQQVTVPPPPPTMPPAFSSQLVGSLVGRIQQLHRLNLFFPAIRSHSSSSYSVLEAASPPLWKLSYPLICPYPFEKCGGTRNKCYQYYISTFCMIRITQPKSRNKTGHF